MTPQKAGSMTPVADDVRRIMSGVSGGGSQARAAAFVVRQALEEAVYEALHRQFGVGRETTFTAQMIALRQVIEPRLAADVAWTWWALSAATHAQGYALPPTIGELERWGETVQRLCDGFDCSSAGVERIRAQR